MAIVQSDERFFKAWKILHFAQKWIHIQPLNAKLLYIYNLYSF